MSERRPAVARVVRPSHRGDALLLKSVPYGDSDLIVTLLTEPLGRVSALARGARRVGRAQTLVVAPMHTLSVVVEERARAELMTLRESKLERVRTRLTASLDALDMAGRGLRWVRALSPAHERDEVLFGLTTSLLDALDVPREGAPGGALLAVFGLRLLAHLGYGLELSRCVRCSRPCPDNAAAFVDAAEGGVICSLCGVGRARVPSVTRLAIRAAIDGDGVLDDDEARVATEWVDASVLARAGEAALS